MNSNIFTTQCKQFGISLTITLDSGYLHTLSKIKIPVPLLEVQKEIVRILDTFTSLEARRKQYEYYRDRLQTFPEGEVHRVKIERYWNS
ncbi:MAG: restriction endonuclease subunit S [Actinomycetaceae bacterium]|nr:restriction endonuclease subunit S [Arcanobacterium sp.]MDD7687063.1 restriction endonuclease subunit S [Actinomycetaceae bacterium]MDY5273279.1 restriction endonuclease subunit S [Arcanobacterium sp.]